MSMLATQARPAVAQLLKADEDNLYEQLGIRAMALAADPSVAGSFDPQVTIDLTEMGVVDEARERFGKPVKQLVVE